jgi:hypothetical protein
LSVPVKPGSITMAGSRFIPRDSTYAYTETAEGELIAQTPGNTSFEAPILIPPGARVTAVTVFVIDNGASTVTAFVARFVPSNDTSSYPATATSAGASTAVQTLTMTPGVTADPVSELAITVLLPATSTYQLRGARVDYS